MKLGILRQRKLLNQPVTLLDFRQLTDYLLAFTGDDIQQSKQTWKRHTGRKNMIDFLSSEYLLDGLTYYQVYSARKKTYKRKIPYTSVKNDIIRYSNGIRKEQRLLTQQLLNGIISAQDWYEQTLFLTKITLRASFTIAEGGYDTFSQERVDRWLLLTSPVVLSYNLKVEQLRDGKREMNGRLLLDADILSDNIATSFENFRYNRALSHGVRQVRRRIYAGDNCHDSGDRKGCVELAARGWMPIWKMPMIGMAACWHKCRCYLEYRWEPDNEQQRQ